MTGMAVKMAIFACIGVAMEVIFTAVSDFQKTGSRRLMGYSYIWMLPIYALVPVFLRVVHPPLEGLILPLRLLIYTAILLAMEYLTGWVLRKLLGEAPWEPAYRGHRFAVDGLVRLDYAPAWALACLIFERLYFLM